MAHVEVIAHDCGAINGPGVEVYAYSYEEHSMHEQARTLAKILLCSGAAQSIRREVYRRHSRRYVSVHGVLSGVWMDIAYCPSMYHSPADAFRDLP